MNSNSPPENSNELELAPETQAENAHSLSPGHSSQSHSIIGCEKNIIQMQYCYKFNYTKHPPAEESKKGACFRKTQH